MDFKIIIFLLSFCFFSAFQIEANAIAPSDLRCETQAECKAWQKRINLLQSQLNSQISLLKAQKPPIEFTEPLKDSFSNQAVNYYKASKYCETLGAKLPSVKDWIEYAEFYGSDGTVSEKFILEQFENVIPVDFFKYEIDKYHNLPNYVPRRYTEKIYYSRSGYDFSKTGLNLYYFTSFWTSDTDDNEVGQRTSSYVFDAYNGSIITHSSSDYVNQYAVVCVK